MPNPVDKTAFINCHPWLSLPANLYTPAGSFEHIFPLLILASFSSWTHRIHELLSCLVEFQVISLKKTITLLCILSTLLSSPKYRWLLWPECVQTWCCLISTLKLILLTWIRHHFLLVWFLLRKAHYCTKLGGGKNDQNQYQLLHFFFYLPGNNLGNHLMVGEADDGSGSSLP